jgi:hypothetical protein
MIAAALKRKFNHSSAFGNTHMSIAKQDLS